MASRSSCGSQHQLQQALLSEPGCTKTALINILQQLHRRNALMPGHDLGNTRRSTKRRLQNAIEARVSSKTPYGPVVQELNLCPEVSQWAIIHPLAWLHFLCEDSDAFATLMAATIGDHAKPLTVVIYIDELCPGNPLRPEKSRTLQAIYWVFAEFPQHVLQTSGSWFLFGVMRSTIASQIPGGPSGLVARILHTFFTSPNNFATGAIIGSHASARVCRAVFGGFLCDEKAHKEIWCVKGASGTKCCVTCKNLVRGVDTSSSNYLQGLSCSIVALLDQHDNDSVYAMVDLLRSSKTIMNKTKFEALQQALGLNWEPHGLLFDDSLRPIVRPIDNCLRDWFHMLLSGGMAGTEIALLLQCLADEGVSHSHVTAFAAAIVLPVADGKVDPLWFDPSRTLADQMRTPSASDHITMVSIMDAFLEDAVRPTGMLSMQTDSFRVLAALIDHLTLGAEAAMAKIDSIEALVSSHHNLFARCYLSHLKPKAHNMLHLTQNMMHIGRLMSCFVTERKHRSVKAAALHTFRHMEKTVLQDLCNRTVEQMRADDCLYKESYLIGGKSVAGNDNVRTSLRANLVCGQITATDIVRLKSEEFARGSCFFERDNNIIVQVEKLPKLRPGWCEAVGFEIAFIDCRELRQAAPFAIAGNNLRVLQ